MNPEHPSDLEEQLREALEEHSETPPQNPSRRIELERRIVRRRRVRVVGAAGFAAVILAGAATGVVTLRPEGPPASTAVAVGQPTQSPPPPPSPSPSPSPAALPDYSSGYHRISNQQIALPGQGSLALRYTPTTLDFTIGLNCADVPKQLLSLEVNNHVVGTTDCGPNDLAPHSPDLMLAGPDFNAHYRSWSDVGIKVGRPVTFTVRVGASVQTKNGGEPSVGPPSASGAVFAGVYLPVPFDQYPFPTRPATLADLDSQRLFGLTGFGDSLGLLDSRQLDSPNGSHTISVTMPQFLDMSFCSIAPGLVRMLVNGQETDQSAFWDWNGHCYPGSAFASDAPEPASLTLKNVHSGQKVTVTIVTSDFAVAGWRVGFERGN